MTLEEWQRWFVVLLHLNALASVNITTVVIGHLDVTGFKDNRTS